MGACLDGCVHHFGTAVKDAADVFPAELGTPFVEQLAHCFNILCNCCVATLLASLVRMPDNVPLQIAIHCGRIFAQHLHLRCPLWPGSCISKIKRQGLGSASLYAGFLSTPNDIVLQVPFSVRRSVRTSSKRAAASSLAPA